MLSSSSRLEGRPWMAEFICRTLRNILNAEENKSLPRLRKAIDAVAGYHPAISKVSFSAAEYAAVPCLVATPKHVVRPKDGDTPVIVYLHGGGYVFGSPKGYRGLLAQLAVNSQAIVIAVDYRLAPEHPYPAPQEDCLNAVRAAFTQFKDHKKIIAGDSAGGALAIMASLALHKEQSLVDGCVLISPWVDPLADQGSMHSNKENDFLTVRFLQDSFKALMNDQTATDLVRFNNVDLSLMPTTLIQCGTGEIFFDQIQHFAERATAAGVRLTLQNTPQQFHVFQLLSPLFKDSRDAVNSIGEFINTL